MNQVALNETPKIRNSGCAGLVTMAEQELAAFFRAVTELFGSEQAELSAEEWLHELEVTDGLPASSREWRRITIKVAKRLAGRVNVPAIGALI
jgi:hypothetical protein